MGSGLEGSPTFAFQAGDGNDDFYIGGMKIQPLPDGYKDGIALIGDSTMAGSSAGFDATNAREFSTFLAGYLNCNVFNRAIGGNKTSDMDNRWESDISPLAINSRYVIIQGGINDIANGGGLADIQGHINSMVGKAHADGLLPILLTASPTASIGENPDYEATRQQLNAWILANFQAIDIAATLADPANPQFLNPAWAGDGVHYSIEGKKAAAQVAARWGSWSFISPAP